MAEHVPIAALLHPWATLAGKSTEMTTSDSPHWFTRCEKSVQSWLLGNPGSALPQAAFDAVIGAGGVPVRVETAQGDRSEAYYLHPADSEFLTELRAAGVDGYAR